jgi:hypothetical protein
MLILTIYFNADLEHVSGEMSPFGMVALYPYHSGFWFISFTDFPLLLIFQMLQAMHTYIHISNWMFALASYYSTKAFNWIFH